MSLADVQILSNSKQIQCLSARVAVVSSVVTGQCPGQVTREKNANHSKFYYDNLFRYSAKMFRITHTVNTHIFCKVF